MKCQYCNEHEAVNNFWVAFPGGTREVHLCEHCTKAAQTYFELVKQNSPGLFQDEPLSSQSPSSPHFPEDAGQAVKNRRHINMLRAKLDRAVKSENYEEAARLRDAIAAEEKDVFAL